MGSSLITWGLTALCLGLCVPSVQAASCPGGFVNGTSYCQQINSSTAAAALLSNSGLCSHNISEYACALRANQTISNSNQLANIMNCIVNDSMIADDTSLTLLFSSVNETILETALNTFNITVNLTSSFQKLQLLFLQALWNAKIRNQPNFTSDIVKPLFQIKLKPFLSAITQDILVCLQNESMGCDAYSAIVQGLNNVYKDMTSDTQRAVYNSFLLPFLKQNSTGPGCISTDTNSSVWLQKYLGQFSSFAQYEEFITLNKNFSGTDAADLLTAVQLADYSLLLFSSALNSTSQISIILNSVIRKGFGPLIDYYTQLKKNSSLIDTNVQTTMFNLTYPLLSQQFSVTNATFNWTYWFSPQGLLQPILSGITADHLRNMTNYLSCQNYQIIITGLNISYPSLKVNGKDKDLYSVMKAYLQTQGNGSACVAGTNGSQDWLQKNLASFRANALYQDLIFLNPNFSALNAADLLTAEQLADFTVSSTALNNTSQITMIFSVVISRGFGDVTTYFTQLNKNSSLIDTNVQTTMFNLTYLLLSQQFSVTNATFNWTYWFSPQGLLQPILSGITADHLRNMTYYLSCQNYQIIITGLNISYPSLKVNGKDKDLYSVMKAYLQAQENSSACVAGTNGSQDWLQKNLASFRANALYQDLIFLNPNFSALNAAGLLTAEQLADFTVNSTAYNNTSQITMILSVPVSRGFSDVTTYFTQLNKASPLNISMDTQTTMFNLIFPLLYQQSSGTNSTFNWTTWFGTQGLFRSILSGISADQLKNITSDSSCSNYQIIVSGLNSDYASLKKDGKDKDLHSAMASYFQKHANATTLPCYVDNINFISYLDNFFGNNFKNLVILQDVFYVVSNNPKVGNATELADLFGRPSFINNDGLMTAFLQNYSSVDLFLDRFNIINVTLNITTKAAILKGAWPFFTKADSSTADQWLYTRLSPYLFTIDKGLLTSQDTMKADCITFKNIVSLLSNRSSNYTIIDTDVYSGIKTYLTNISSTDQPPRCSNITVNGSVQPWFSSYFVGFIQYSSSDDMLSFANRAQLQKIVNNAEDINFMGNAHVPNDVAELYTDLLFANTPSFNVSGLPDKLLCYAKNANSIKSLKPQEALSIIDKVNSNCNSSLNNGSTAPSPASLQLAASLVSKINALNGSVLTSLGQQAVGLSLPQIQTLTSTDIQSSLANLGALRGWNQGQAKALISKLFNGNIQITDVRNLTSLGSLTQGLPSAALENVPANLLSNATADQTFVNNLLSASPVLQQTVVQKLVSLNKSPNSILTNVPDALAGQISPSAMIFRNSLDGATLDMINKKNWKPQQAAVFFENVATSTTNYTQLSTQVVQGFSCGIANKLSSDNYNSLIKSAKGKDGSLFEGQLGCMGKAIFANGTPTDLNEYPVNALLFINTTQLNNLSETTCTDYFKVISSANISVMEKGSVKRNSIINNVLKCLKITNGGLSASNVTFVNNLACGMSASVISSSDVQIVEVLKTCSDLSSEQLSAISDVLNTKTSLYGSPTSWNVATLKRLNTLPLDLNYTLLQGVTKEDKNAYIENVVRAYPNDKVKAKLATLIQNMQTSRVSKRAAGCSVENITLATILGATFPADYSTDQFDKCLDDDVLTSNLDVLASKPLTSGHLTVIHSKLNLIYPGGLPENQIQLLRSIARSFTPAELSNMNITTVDTLQSLLDPAEPVWSNASAKAIITRFLQLGGQLDPIALNAIGGLYLCTLDYSQINSSVNSTGLRDASPLDISTCNQSTKDLLYSKAKDAFSSFSSSTNAYYSEIKSYLGGAPSDDLKTLANSNITMDILTFTKLNPSSVKNLTVSTVQTLLGINTPDLKDNENNTVVQQWIASQRQSDLNTLGIGLLGGIADTTTAATMTTTAASSATTATTSTTTKTTKAENTPFGFIVLTAAVGTGSSINIHFLHFMKALILATLATVAQRFI